MLWEQGVAGPNPVAPTIYKKNHHFGGIFVSRVRGNLIGQPIYDVRNFTIGDVKMKRIYAISDGLFRKDAKIDQTLVNLTHKEHPKIVLLPMPLELPAFPIEQLEKWVASFHKRYGEELGCQTDTIFTRDNPSQDLIREKILSADAVYVGPGHIPTMMEKMREFGFDEVLKEAYEKGIIMAGMSAGALCWFDPHLGFVNSEFHPHYQGYEPIRSGYAANDPTATLFVDGHVGQIVKLDPNANLYGFRKDANGRIVRVRLITSNEQNTRS